MPREIARKPRFIYPTIASSLTLAKISALAELFFWRIVPQADDQGRLFGHPKQLKALACPMRNEITEDNIPQLLNELEQADLITQYSTSADPLIQIRAWWSYQSGMKRIYPSRYPAPEGWQDRTKAIEHVEETGTRIEEHGIRDLVLDALMKGDLQLGDAKIINVNKEVRVGNSYIDLLAKDSTGKFYIIELKRTRLTNSHIEQIINYGDLLETKIKTRAALFLIGYGIVETFNADMAETHLVNVITYDDQLSFRQVVLSNVTLVGELTQQRSSNVTLVGELTQQRSSNVVPPISVNQVISKSVNQVISKSVNQKVPLEGFPALKQKLIEAKNKVGFLVETFKAYHAHAPPEDFENTGGRLAAILKSISNDYLYVAKVIWDTSSVDIAGSHLNYIQGKIRGQQTTRRTKRLPTEGELKESL